MNADRKRTFVAPTPSASSRELSQRVKRLEFLRSDAHAHRDRVRIAFIDRQIKNTILEWCDSFVTDIDTSTRHEPSACSELRVCQSPSSSVN